jgi:transposase
MVVVMAYGVDFREAVLVYRQKGHTVKQVCETFNIPKKTCRNRVNLKQQTGNLKPKKPGIGKQKIRPPTTQTIHTGTPKRVPKRNSATFQCQTLPMHIVSVKLKK